MTKQNKVLIVDDDPIIRDAYITILKSAGYSVTAAVNGKEGLKQAKKLRPNLIILDIIMPEVDGLAFLKEYNPKSHPESKIIVLSNSAFAHNITDAFRLGVEYYLVKTDLTPQDIRAVVNGLMGR